jgi:Rrf2 family iron-sulfur cluster assembly transcriptional regulator
MSWAKSEGKNSKCFKTRNMLSNGAKYAIRATMHLAEIDSGTKRKLSAKSIADNLDVPLSFLSKLLQELARKEIISSSKGPKGGFYLSDENRKRSIWDVIHCIDGVEKFTKCFLGLPTCTNENPCSVHSVVASFRKKILNEFRNKNIQKIADEYSGSKFTIEKL